MKLIVKYGALTEERTLTTRQMQWLATNAKKTLRTVSLAVERRLKAKDPIPVDTGRARASWGHWSPGDLRKQNPDASPEDSVWDDAKDGGWSIEQGSNVPYIDALNDGHSQKTPAGFLERAEEAGVQELDRKLEDLLQKLARE